MPSEAARASSVLRSRSRSSTRSPILSRDRLDIDLARAIRLETLLTCRPITEIRSRWEKGKPAKLVRERTTKDPSSRMLLSVIGGPGKGDTLPAWRLRSSKMRAESTKQKPAQAEWTGLLPTKQLVPDV